MWKQMKMRIPGWAADVDLEADEDEDSWLLHVKTGLKAYNTRVLTA